MSALLGAATFMHFCGRNLADPDMWGHLARGREILRAGAIIRVDTLSYTVPGQPFYNHEWLADVVIAALFGLLGSGGLLLLKLTLGVVMLGAMLDGARTLASELRPRSVLHPVTTVAVLVLVLAVIAPGATFRPQLFSMAGLALEWALLERADRRLRASGRFGWELLVVPLLLLVWANLHGGFLIGIALIGIHATAVASRVLWPIHVPGDVPLRSRHAVGILAVAAAAAIASIANPHGPALYVFLAETLGVHGESSEWQPITLLGGDFLRFKLLVIATAVTVGFWTVGRRDLALVRTTLDWRVAFLTVATLYAFRHQRHAVLFAIAAAPVLMALVEAIRGEVVTAQPRLRLSPAASAMIGAGALGVAGLQMLGIGSQLARHGFDIRYARLGYPLEAVQFLTASGLGGNVAAPFIWGAYVHHKLGPQSRVFIDERFDAVYPPWVIEDYFAFAHGTPGWERLLDDYPTDVVIVQRGSGIHPRLFARPDLTYVYSDPVALVFVRRSERTAAALDRVLASDRRPAPQVLAATFP